MDNSVAVIIVNFNAQAYILRCLDAIATQTVLPDRVIVIDNGSTDESIHLARQNHPLVEYIELGKNQGFAAANNHAVSVAGDVKWVALINPDAFISTTWLETLLNASKDHPQATFFSSELMCDSPKDQVDGRGDCYHLSGLVWRRHHGRIAPIDVDSEGKQPVFSPCAAAVLYEREVFEEVGGFDEDFFCYIEDVDLVFRMRLYGYSGHHIQTAIAYHVGSGITVKESDFSIYHGHRNLVWAYIKNMPTGLLLKTLPQHLLLNLLTLIYYSLKGRPGIIFKAKWHALKGLNKALAKRKSIQQLSSQSSEKLLQFMTKGWLTPYIRRHR